MPRWCRILAAVVVLLTLMVVAPINIHADSPETALDAPVSEAAAVGDVITETLDADLHLSDDAADSIAEPANKPAFEPVWRTLDPAYSDSTPLPVSGKAMYYNPGVMQIVFDSRIKYDQIEPCQRCIGYVAMLRYGDLNRRVWLQVGRSRLEGPFHVIDAAATQHVGQLLAREWVVDVDYQTAVRWGMRMPYVTLWEDPPLDLLLAANSLPLHWSATLAPDQAFAGLPQTQDVPLQHLDNGGAVVKQILELRRRTTRSYVDLAADLPSEIYVR